jgi:molybdenum cofactor guanylyltransferase
MPPKPDSTFDPEPADWQLGILLGGQSRRMGRDKAALSFAGTTLLDRVRRRCAPPNTEVLFALGTREFEVPEGCRGVTDRIVNAGPLAGFEAMRAVAEADFLAVVPCDMPFLRREDLERLVAAARRAEAPTARFRLGDRLAPLPVVLGRTTASSLARALQEGHNKLIGWDADGIEISLDPDDDRTERTFLNINDEGDLERARGLLGPVDGSEGDC